MNMQESYAKFVESRISPHVTQVLEVRLMHIAMGLITEAGEFCDPIKKAMTKAMDADDLDFVNMDEEIGDLLFYIQDYANLRGLSIPYLCYKNQAKLTKRYPQQFTAEHSDNRDLEGERRILEGDQDEA